MCTSIVAIAVTPYNPLTAFPYPFFGFPLSADATLSLLLRKEFIGTRQHFTWFNIEPKSAVALYSISSI